MRLRDHDQPCEKHGLTGVHSYDVMTHPDGSTVAEFCPGGREVVGVLRDWCETHDVPFQGEWPEHSDVLPPDPSCVMGQRLIVEVEQR